MRIFYVRKLSNIEKFVGESSSPLNSANKISENIEIPFSKHPSRAQRMNYIRYSQLCRKIEEFLDHKNPNFKIILFEQMFCIKKV